MLKLVDRGFAVLLLLGAAGHAMGSFTLIEAGSLRVWSLGSALCAVLLAVLNWVRAGRADDKTLAWICVFGLLGWAVIVVLFGQAIGNFADFRVIWHGLCALALTGFSVRTARATN